MCLSNVTLASSITTSMTNRLSGSTSLAGGNLQAYEHHRHHQYHHSIMSSSTSDVPAFSMISPSQSSSSPSHPLIHISNCHHTVRCSFHLYASTLLISLVLILIAITVSLTVEATCVKCQKQNPPPTHTESMRRTVRSIDIPPHLLPKRSGDLLPPTSPGRGGGGSGAAVAAPWIEGEDERAEDVLRLEYIKSQILHKLGLNEPPKALPLFPRERQEVVEQILDQRSITEEDPWQVDTTPSTGDTTQEVTLMDKVLIFPVRTSATSATFNVSLPAHKEMRKISLSLKRAQAVDASRESLTVDELTPDILSDTTIWVALARSGDASQSIPLGSVSSSGPEDEQQWLHYDLSHLIGKKSGDDDDATRDPQDPHPMMPNQLLLQVESISMPIKQPVVKIEYEDISITRRKRNVDCPAAVVRNASAESTEVGGDSATVQPMPSCCRESFYVNFTQIGWDDWIIQPSGSWANYCRGACDLSHARYHHTTVVGKYPHLISLCCSPRVMSHISLIYVDKSGEVFRRDLPNMRVESCDCA